MSLCAKHYGRTKVETTWKLFFRILSHPNRLYVWLFICLLCYDLLFMLIYFIFS